MRSTIVKWILNLFVGIALTTSTVEAQTIILTSDQQLNDLTDPDKKIDNSLGYVLVWKVFVMFVNEERVMDQKN